MLAVHVAGLRLGAKIGFRAFMRPKLYQALNLVLFFIEGPALNPLTVNMISKHLNKRAIAIAKFVRNPVDDG